MSIIINGSPTKPFHMERGLWQGDSLSLFLFVLVVEVLNRLLSKAQECGFIEGIKVGKDGIMLSHLQFVDDTILFYLKNLEVMVNTRCILDYFGICQA